jgi:hypothetical protein
MSASRRLASADWCRCRLRTAHHRTVAPMLPKQHWPPHLDLGLDEDLPLVEVVAAVRAGANRDDALSKLVPARVVRHA